jgi:3-phenylpropionate/trans-cinnamate dioxygenase ferredoxin reductase component
MPTNRRHVIVGASAAGVSAAIAMRDVGYDGEIVLLDRDPHLPYERPPLSKSLAVGAESSLKPIVAESTYAERALDLRLGTQVSALDPGSQAVELADGSAVRADHVILAVGLAARPLSVPGAGLRNIVLLRDAADAAALTSRLIAGGPMVIVGAGFIGLELAALATQAGIDVTVVELAPAPLWTVLGKEIGRMVQELHQQQGVRFVLERTVSEFLGRTEVEEVLLNDGSRIQASTVVVGVGTVARDRLALAAGVAVDRGVIVDAHGQTSNPWISAAGDIARQPHRWLDGPARIEHWDVALRHGQAVGMTVAGRPTTYDGVPYAWSDQFTLTLQIFGRPTPLDTFVLRDGSRPDKFLGFWLRNGRIRAVAGLNTARDVRAAKALIESGLAVSAEVLAATGTDLRALQRQDSRSRD